MKRSLEEIKRRSHQIDSLLVDKIIMTLLTDTTKKKKIIILCSMRWDKRSFCPSLVLSDLGTLGTMGLMVSKLWSYYNVYGPAM